jgi:hypothetical protein
VAATTASAVESQFGGFWQVESVFRDNFVQPDSAQNYTHARTRLYYTAKFSDNLKFVNKFEFDTDWGDRVGGDIGADGNVFELKNSYVDFTLGMVNAKVGIQGATIARGFIFSDDFSGAVLTGDFGMVKVPILYAAGPQDDVNNDTTAAAASPGLTDSNGDTITVDDAGNPVAAIATSPGASTDTHLLSVMPKISINDNISVTPHVTWLTETSVETDIFWVGADVDAKFDAVSVWGTFIYNGGEENDNDISAFLVAAGANANLGSVGVHGQGFYSSGDDDLADPDHDEFQQAPGSSYYWSEIMGLGQFDYNSPTPANAPGDNITNVWAANVGVTVKPMDKLTLGFDVWYAELAEDNAAGDSDLGLELDGIISYQVMDNLKADVIFAYLVAGDATGPEDIMEGGVQLTLGF